MKRIGIILALTMVICFMVICSGCQQEGNKENKDNTKEIPFESGDWYYEYWIETPEFSLNVEAIPDKETAIEVASAIFKSVQKEGLFPDYKPQSVLYDEKYSVWIVSFWEDREFSILGNDCSIALQKSDGKVLLIWPGE